MRFSYSQVHMYEKNPWKHFCNYVMNLKAPQTEQAVRGTNVHSVFETLAKLPEDTDWINYIDELHNEEKIDDTAWRIVRRYLLNYSGKGPGLLSENRLPWKDAYKVECEKNVTTTFNGIDFVGYIDLVVYHDDNTVTLYDYKTLSHKPSILEYSYGMQGNLYIAAMEKLGYKVNKFIFDCMNPKEEIPWNGYHFLRIELQNNPLNVNNSVKRFSHLAREILYNPSYYNTFDGWSDKLHVDAWKALMRSSEELFMFCQNNGVDVNTSLANAVTMGYPLPYFFTIDTPECLPEFKEHSLKIVKKELKNRKKTENWTTKEITQESDDFDYLILINSKGTRQFTKDYTEVHKFTDEEIKSLEFGVNYL